jgi:hypothetical protein
MDAGRSSPDRGMCGWSLVVRRTRLMRVTEIRPAADTDAPRWLLRSDVDWWDLVRYGPPGFDVYVRIAFPQESGAGVVNPSDEAPADAIRTALATLASYTTTPATGYAAIWEGWGPNSAPQAPRVEIPLEPCCSSPALSKHSETHQLWLGAALQRVSTRHRTSCGRRIRPGVWPARSTRRSSSPWVVTSTRPKLWLSPAGCCSTSALRGAGSHVPRAGLVREPAHRHERATRQDRASVAVLTAA